MTRTAPAPQTVERGRTLPSLTGLRAAAAAAVLLRHLPIVSFGDGPDAIHRIGAPGVAGVTFFFVLSGFVLTWSSANRPAGQFYRYRFARIYPALAVALLVGIVVSTQAHDTVDALRVALTFGGLQAWVPQPDYIFAINGVTWSLSCEAFFYLCFPLYVRRLMGASLSARRLLAAAIISAMCIVTIIAFAFPSDGTRWLLEQCPLTRTGDFVLGVLLAIEIRDGTLPKLSWRHAIYVACGSWLLACAAPEAARYTVIPVIPVILVIGAAAQRDLAGVGTIFGGRRLVFLGTISYSFYLLHAMVIEELAFYLSDFAVLCLAPPLALLAAYVLHRFIESPAERIIRGSNSRADRVAVDPR